MTAGGQGRRPPADGGQRPGWSPAAQQRRAELATNLAAMRVRVADACAAAGRDQAELTLVAVTKTYPAADVLRLAELGLTDVGENRDQEAAPKAAEVAAALGAAAVRWHFVGQLQRNKCRSVVGYADLVHSVDSVRLARALGDAAQRHRDRPLDVLVQVSIDGDPARGGAVDAAHAPAERRLAQVVAAVAERPALRLRGVMAVAPQDWAPREAFTRLAGIAGRLRADHPDATVLSAGMSADLEAAIACGATHLRVGSALLGKRAALG